MHPLVLKIQIATSTKNNMSPPTGLGAVCLPFGWGGGGGGGGGNIKIVSKSNQQNDSDFVEILFL